MIEVRDLVKNHGEFSAFNHTSFTVASGRIFGFLGPNGAGKTTTIQMLLIGSYLFSRIQL
jgi:ABC-type multidrug transport system ATPase subunit